MFKFRIIALECTMVIGSSYFFLPENFITMERSLGNAFDPEQSKSYVSLMKFYNGIKQLKKIPGSFFKNNYTNQGTIENYLFLIILEVKVQRRFWLCQEYSGKVIQSSYLSEVLNNRNLHNEEVKKAFQVEEIAFTS